MHTKFDDIRPYFDSEFPEAMKRVSESEYFPALAKFVFPNIEVEEAKKIARNYSNIYDFQMDAMYRFNEQVIERTIDKFTYSGLNKLDPSKAYLFVSNHRDIVMDSSLLQYILVCNGFRTTDITFGSNLMSSPLIIDLGRSNKMFKVMRGETPREFYKTSLHLSQYIRHAIIDRNESVWIAQRNGRTKDGNDTTDQGIIKMFCMSGDKDQSKALNDLNIVPVSISYQYEPCDFFKTRELYLSRNGAKYNKEKDEDLISVLTGIKQYKGNVNISVCDTIDTRLIDYSISNNNLFYKQAANLINQYIFSNYKLYNTNYIAHDLRSKSNTYTERYTAESKEKFMEIHDKILDKFDTDKDIISNIFLDIYANSVDNVEMCSKK